MRLREFMTAGFRNGSCKWFVQGDNDQGMELATKSPAIWVLEPFSGDSLLEFSDLFRDLSLGFRAV